MYRCKSTNTLKNKKKPDDIALDENCVQRFFSYFVIDIYNRLFTDKAPRKSFDINNRVFGQFQERFMTLKEAAKPILGRNEIAIYIDQTHELKKFKVNLTKEVHGYVNFPEGTRHIVVNDTLYIIGGVDTFGNPICTVLSFNLTNFELKRITDTIFPHSYHSLEYLENYDCLVLVGGERNSTCEMFDLSNLTWTPLPDLNFPRANITIYFNEKTSELYAMFGMTGSIFNKKNYSDVIEVLKICDAALGWVKVDYYKNSMIDLSNSYIVAFPFTLDKLIIRGTKNARSSKITYAIYDMEKREMTMASEKLVHEIQTQEVMVKSYSNALNINLNERILKDS